MSWKDFGLHGRETPEDACAYWVTVLQHHIQWLDEDVAELLEKIRVEADPGAQRSLARTHRLLLLESQNVRSMYDLFRRGLDPERSRRFRGRVSLIVRCIPKGHELACIYPTAHWPVFVPTVRTSLEEDRAKRWAGVAGTVETNVDEWRARGLPVEESEIRAVVRQRIYGGRDPWIQRPLNSPLDSQRPEEDPVPVEGMYAIRTPENSTLVCRCGVRELGAEILRQALINDTRVISI